MSICFQTFGFMPSACAGKGYFQYCTLFIPRKVSLLTLLNVFLLVNVTCVQPVFYPIPTGGTWGPTDGMFVNECGTDAAVPVTSLLCWWTPHLSCKHSVSFPLGLGRSALHLFPSVFYLVAMENECVNSH